MLIVFVFGTLKEGFPNFHVNAGRRLPGEYETAERYPLFLVGERLSPWMVSSPGIGHHVRGQLFEVDERTLLAMDKLERIDEPDGYERIEFLVRPASGLQGAPVVSFAYLKAAAQLADDLPREGPFVEYTLEHAARYRSRSA